MIGITACNLLLERADFKNVLLDLEYNVISGIDFLFHSMIAISGSFEIFIILILIINTLCFRYIYLLFHEE